MTNEQQPIAKPIYTDDDIKALRRFAETCEDGEGYDLPKVTMVRLARIGLVRRCTGNIYEVTYFGSSILEPEFWLPATEQEPPAEILAGRAIDAWCEAPNSRDVAAPIGEAQQGPDDYRSMFGASVASLSEISEALGIDEESAMCANGNELILDAIAELKSPRLETPEQGEADRRDAAMIYALRSRLISEITAKFQCGGEGYEAARAKAEGDINRYEATFAFNYERLRAQQKGEPE